LSSVFLPHYLDNCDENIKLVIQEGEITEMINDDYNPSGNKRVFRMYKFPMVMEKGGDLKAGWMMDITTLMDTEQALNESNERYRFACKASSDVIWEWDVTGESITIGEGYEFLLGYKKSNNVNTLLSHIHPDDLAGVKEAIQQSIHQKEKQWQLEYRYICASGEVKNCINRGFLIWDNASKLVKIIGALQDVTPYKVLQQQLLQEQETRECSIIEAMFEGQETERQHIGIELHDNINQLLVTVLLLLKSYRISPDQGDLIIPKSIDILTDALQEIRKLTHQLIVPTFTDTSFSETISEIVHSLTLAGIKEVSVELHQNCFLEKLDGPLKLHLYRILQEGVSNIIKYANAKHVNISIKVSGNSLLLRVKDDGVGFDLQEKRKGIGLKNICSRVKLHAGNVQINAAKNQGCELIVHIPLS
jgi:two-component system sensor histidine kinase UhpB